MPDVTRILAAIEQDFPGAAEQLLTLEHDKLRTLVAAKLACERLGQTRDATGWVHEAYIRLVERGLPEAEQEAGRRLAAARSGRCRAGCPANRL
jgi:hypothetical protein